MKFKPFLRYLRSAARIFIKEISSFASHSRWNSQSYISCFETSEFLKTCTLNDGKTVHAHMIKTHLLYSVYLPTRLVVFYVKCGRLADGRHVFNSMRDRSVVSWTAMISGYSQNSLNSEAQELFLKMTRSGTNPNEFTLSSVLTCCTGVHDLILGRQIHAHILKGYHESHVFVGSSLLDMYAKSGEVDEARKVFEEMPKRDVVSCTAMISGYAQQGKDEEAVKLFRKLHFEGMQSNYVTYASLLTALSGLAALDLGKQVHNHVLRQNLPSTAVLHNSLVDMYAKCGNLGYARKVFDKTPERTLVSWNAMLVGYSKHGMGKQMLNLFDLMKTENRIRPDGVSLLAILSGCSHGKLMQEGLRIFGEMVVENDVVRREHYGCVVDMLGRCGELEKAVKMVQDMPFDPTPAMWGSLLGACRVHKNVEIGEYVGRKLIGVEPENAGNYVILCNLYAANGRWEDANNLRELMRQNAVVKEPGRSWIEIGQTVHTFHAGERSHSFREEIFAKVLKLSEEFKEIGYVPNLSCVLYDVDDEQKEKIVLSHSEKLALAFGVMSLPSGVPIRIIKNLRICEDCHEFAKCLSLMYGRDVSLRDKSRFHNIVGGKCSCEDHW